MVYMSLIIKLEIKVKGGVFGVFKCLMFGGESFFVNMFRVEDGFGSIGFVLVYMGDIEVFEFDGIFYV